MLPSQFVYSKEKKWKTRSRIFVTHFATPLKVLKKNLVPKIYPRISLINIHISVYLLERLVPQKSPSWHSQQTLTNSQATTETLEKSEICINLTIMTPERHDVLNITFEHIWHLFSFVSIVEFKQVNVFRDFCGNSKLVFQEGKDVTAPELEQMSQQLSKVPGLSKDGKLTKDDLRILLCRN